MAAIKNARERAREELTREIKAEARRQLAEQGAQQLSLRAVARELGMVSSALYRYFPSRDELLTALILDAYQAMGDAVDAALAEAEAAATGDGPVQRRDRWRALAHAVRAWALEHPHEYALLYGTPVPGYAAPQETVAAAARVPLTMVALVAEAVDAGAGPRRGRRAEGELAEQLGAVAAQLVEAGAAPDTLAPTALARGIAAWTQLYGVISFELFGHLVGSADPAAPFFDFVVEDVADDLGL